MIDKAVVTYSGHDAYELLRMSSRHESVLDMLRIFLGCDITRAARADEAKLGRFWEVNDRCKLCLDESLNTDTAERQDVKDAFRELFEIAGSSPYVKLELIEDPKLPGFEESFKALVIKSGVQFVMNYPGKVDNLIA